MKYKFVLSILKKRKLNFYIHLADPILLLCSYQNRTVITGLCHSSVKMFPYTSNKKSVDFLLQAHALKHWPFYWLWHRLLFSCCLLPSKGDTISADWPSPRQKDNNIYTVYTQHSQYITLSFSYFNHCCVFGLPFACKYKHGSVFVCWISSVLEDPLSHFLMDSWLSAFRSHWTFFTKQCVLGRVAEMTSLCAASA